MPSSYSFGFPELLLSSRLAEAGGEESWSYEIALAADGARQPFLIAAGLEQALNLLDDLAQAAADLALLRAEPGPQRIDASLDGESLARVGALRFHGDVEAVPEGTVVFAGEPLLRVRAPAAEAAAVIGAVAGVVRTQTAVATRVARLRLAAKGKPIWEAAGEQVTRDEALLIARAAQVGGAVGTTDPFAAAVHSLAALPQVPFSALVEMDGKLRGLGHCAVVVDGRMRRNPGAALAALSEAPRALVVDAGPDGLLDGELRSLRARLDEMGYAATRLLVGGVCDELRIGALASGGAPIDGFVTGATLLTGRHALHEELLAELVERTTRSGIQPVGRRDGGSGPRAVWRRRECGQFRGDTVQADTQAPPPASAPLLVPMMRGGKRLFRAPSLAEVRVLCEAQLSMLDAKVTALVDRVAYPLAFVGEAGPSQAAPKPAAVDASAPPAAPPAAPPKPRLIDQVDDSADFTLVSNAFATVMTEQLGFESREEPAAAAPLEAPVEASVDAPVAPVAPAEEPTVVAEQAVVEERAPAVAEPLAPVTSPLLAAAARLRAMQRGEPLPSAPAASVALLESAPPPAPEPAAAPPPAAAAVSDNPLLAAAARLRSMRGG